MTRSRLVVGNWKMNPATIADGVTLARAVAAIDAGAVRVGVAPAHVALAAVGDALRGSRVELYAQDLHWEDKGAYTGQIAASMVRGIAAGSIVGHSEVRRDQGDTDERIAKKLARGVAAGLRLILCVGETEAQFAAGETQDVLARQIAADVASLDRAAELTIAYEPVWAIGTGRAATAEHAVQAARTIRGALARAGRDGESTLLLYGGSVSGANAAEFARADGIDGALVGGASLKPDDFAAIVRCFG